MVLEDKLDKLDILIINLFIPDCLQSIIIGISKDVKCINFVIYLILCCFVTDLFVSVFIMYSFFYTSFNVKIHLFLKTCSNLLVPIIINHKS